MGVALKANVPACIRLVGSNPTPVANKQPVLDGIEGTPYKRVHIVRLNEVVPNKWQTSQEAKAEVCNTLMLGAVPRFASKNMGR